MENTMTAVSLGRFLRTQRSLKVRQPLRKAVIVVHSDEVRGMLEQTSDIIAEELNVKKIEFEADEEKLVNRTVKANFKALGPRLGKEMKDAATQISKLTPTQISAFINGGKIELELASGTKLELLEDDLLIQREEKEGMTVATESGVTIALDTSLDRELEEEGFAREFVSRVQNMRKEKELQVSDRIEISYAIDSDFKSAVKNFSDYICNETLCVVLKEVAGLEAEKTDVNGIECFIDLEKTKNC
jgi:isoleucyl-tRNA synthetase